ncbi:L-aspartate oxidase [Amphibacillus sediminis]|uniref:L-aspartate oxidase n=1 Tax=Amphibacillus sediminis TaxID=360185 RepID=UPI00082F970D|nr:L-aspartate oxidase [Amphibacillus sediminis]
MKKTDVLIVGGGLAGVITALKLVDCMQVTVVMQGDGNEGNSWKAQGGIAAALAKTDCADLHAADTLQAGYYKNDSSSVHVLTQEGKNRVSHWINQGLSFDRTQDGGFDFAREGAHSMRRILHAGGDQTGKRLMTFFTEKLNGRVEYLTGFAATELMIKDGQCAGARFINKDGLELAISANFTILATGGIGGLFSETSNDTSLIGSGLVIAWQAGADLKDLEYIQFHPTLITSQNRTVGLASEALRGEGAVLRSEDGRAIMDGIHPMKDLAPRDVVARTLDNYIQNGKRVFLDISSINQFNERFPQIAQLCSHAGINWQEGYLPVKPGAHFHMGGIKTDLWGRTTVKRLYAVGEVACTGVHGANRLASNSLLEAIVFGERTGEGILEGSDWGEIQCNKPRTWQTRLKSSHQLPKIAEIRQRVSRSLGVLRRESMLKEFILWTETYLDHTDQITDNQKAFTDIKKVQMLIAANLIAKAAVNNKDSCGFHTIETIEGEVRL